MEKILIHNSGGGLGDSIQLFPLIISLKNYFKTLFWVEFNNVYAIYSAANYGQYTAVFYVQKTK